MKVMITVKLINNGD